MGIMLGFGVILSEGLSRRLLSDSEKFDGKFVAVVFIKLVILMVLLFGELPIISMHLIPLI
jgi:hypothetical protein